MRTAVALPVMIWKRYVGCVGSEYSESPSVHQSPITNCKRRLRPGKVRPDDADGLDSGCPTSAISLSAAQTGLLVDAAHRRLADEEHDAQARAY